MTRSACSTPSASERRASAEPELAGRRRGEPKALTLPIPLEHLLEPSVPRHYLWVQERPVLAAGIVDGTAGRDGSGMLASRPVSRRLEGLSRSWRNAVLYQQIAAATRVTDHRNPPVRQQHFALVPSDSVGCRVWVSDPGIPGVFAHSSGPPRSRSPKRNRGLSL